MFARYTFALLTALSLVAPSALAATPIGATVVYVEGKAEVIPRAMAKGTPLKRGATVQAGDTIVTGRDGVVEIRFDNNDQILIDQRTRMTVQALHRDDRGSSFSIFGLLFGRVKSAVSKLLTKESRFEYQTKAAVAGVAGTPPWVVGYDETTQTTEVDLLGKPGEEGAVSVGGLGPDARRVNVLPGMRTLVGPTGALRKPFPISAARMRSLTQMRFRAPLLPPKAATPPAEPTPEPEKKEAEEKPSPVKDILKTQASHTVSTPAKLAPTSEKNAADFNAGTSSQQGTVGEIGGEQDAPLPATYRIEVDFR